MPSGFLLSGLLGDTETEALFADAATILAMLQVEGALARVQGELGIIPGPSAQAIDEASLRVALDPAEIALGVSADGVPVPSLVASFRRHLSPDHGQFLHWGATSQDILDTALNLRLREALAIAEIRIDRLLGRLATLAEDHARTPMTARTYGQAATPTSFGAVAAGWGRPLLRHRERLERLRPELLLVSLGGAAGTLSAMGEHGPEVRARLAQVLGLGDPGASWHTERDGVQALSGWAAGVLGSLGKMGEDLLLLAQSGTEEARLAGAGGSSTMPQKENPVAPSALVALARHGIGLAGVVQGAALHRQQRDGAAWFTEWLALPSLCVALGAALLRAGEALERLRPDSVRMDANLRADHGLIHAEALTFLLAPDMGRPQAQEAVKDLCAAVRASGRSLSDVAGERFPGRDWGRILTPEASLGTAPAEALAFVRAVRKGGGA